MTQTKKLNQPVKKRRSANGTASLSLDKGNLRIKFPAVYAQKVWGEPQVYFYLGLHHSSEFPANLAFAERLEQRINDDLKKGTVDESFDTYRQLVKEFKASHPKSGKGRPSYFFDYLGQFFQRETVSSVYERYAQYRKRSLEETTFLNDYCGTVKKILDNCPQDLNNHEEIRNYILDNYAKCTAKKTLNMLYRAIEWAQCNKIISRDILNPYKYEAAEVKVSKSNRTPKMIRDLEDEGEIDIKDANVCAFSPDEARAIIEAFELWMARTAYDSTPWDLIVKFLFWTGCRHGECAALHWNDISSDCLTIRFRFSYSRRFDIRKGLKTSGKGADFRLFKCQPGSQLQQLLLSIRPTGDFDKDTPVFCNRNGGYICFANFGRIWRGCKDHSNCPGILPQLMKEGKVQYYLPPYSTRHTFINAMLQAGHSSRVVAEIAGHSPSVLENYYLSSSRQNVIPVEL